MLRTKERPPLPPPSVPAIGRQNFLVVVVHPIVADGLFVFATNYTNVTTGLWRKTAGRTIGHTTMVDSLACSSSVLQRTTDTLSGRMVVCGINFLSIVRRYHDQRGDQNDDFHSQLYRAAGGTNQVY